MAKVFKNGSWWEKTLPANAPIHPSSSTWLAALTALDVSESNHLNGAGQGHISLNVPDPGGQFDCPIFRVTGSDTSYPVWSMGANTPNIPVRWAPTSQGGSGEGLRIPEYAKTNYWIKPSTGTTGPNTNDSPIQIIDAARGYVGWLSDTYWNKDTLRWECWNGLQSGVGITFSGGTNIFYFASYGIDSGDFNETTKSKPSFWPATLKGTGVNPTTYQDDPRNQGTGRGNNSYFRVVNYDDFIANGGLTHVCEVYLTATGNAGMFPMKGFETGRGGDIPEGARMRVKASFTDAQITAKLSAAGLTGARLAQATLFIKGFRDYGVYVGDNSGSNSRVKLEDKTQESAGGTNPWIVQTNDLQAFGWGDWEVIDANYDPPLTVITPPPPPPSSFELDERGHTVVGSVDEKGHVAFIGTGPVIGGGGGGVSAWRSAELYGGTGNQSIAYDPLGKRVVIGGDFGGVKASLDSGATWQQSLGGAFDDTATASQLEVIAVTWSKDPAKPNRVWAGTRGGFFVSDNAGRDWSQIASWPGSFVDSGSSDRPRVTGRCIVDDGNGRLYLIDNPGRVYRYENFPSNGIGTSSSWTKITDFAATGTGLALDPTTNTVLYATTREGGLYQLEGIHTNVVNGATSRHFTDASAPNAGEEVRAVSENGNVKLYVATSGEVKKGDAATPGLSGQISSVFNTITPGALSGQGWCAIDAVRNAADTQTRVVVGCSVPSVASNGLSEVYYAADGNASSPSWQLLTGNNAAMGFVNQMGGPGGAPWWGYGLRAGAVTREKDLGRWVLNTAGNGSVESVAFDPANLNRVLMVGESGAWVADLATSTMYPAHLGLMTSRDMGVWVDPFDDLHIMITGADNQQFSTATGGAGGDWRKNSVGVPTSGGEINTFFSASPSSRRWWAGVGDETNNLNGAVLFNDDPRGGATWRTMGFSSGGKRPLGVAARRIGAQDKLVIAVQNGGIFKATFSSATPPVISGSWTLQSDAGAFRTMGSAPRSRSVPIYWVSDTLLYAYDPTNGIYRSTDAGNTWTLIWNVVCDGDRQGFICTPPDEPGTIYASFGLLAPAGKRGVWRLTSTDTGNSVEDGTIPAILLKNSNGQNFTNPSAIACTSGGMLGVVDVTTADLLAYLSTDGGASFAEVDDPYFTRGAHRVWASAMTTTGRWFVVTKGIGTLVYDTGSVTGPPIPPTTLNTQTTFDYVVGSFQEESVDWDEVITTVTINQLTAGSSDADAASYATASVTPTAGRTVYAAIESAMSDGTAPQIPTASGAGLTWTRIQTNVYDGSTTLERRRLTVFQGTGTPSTGAVTFDFAGVVQTHAAWFLIGSNGSVVQSAKAQATGANQIAINVVPVRPVTTFLSFVSKKGNLPLQAGPTSVAFSQVSNALPVGDHMAMITSMADPTTILATSTDSKDLGMITLELGSAAAIPVTTDFDYITQGTAPSYAGKRRIKRNNLSRVFVTVDGAELPLQDDWEFSETAYGGYDKATFSVPHAFGRQKILNENSPITFWNESGSELWTGAVSQPPEKSDGLLKVECEGAQYAARGNSRRLLYQTIGTDGWATGDADPFNYQMDHLYNASVNSGRLLVQRSKVDSGEKQLKNMFQRDDQAGWVFWAQGADISRVAFVIKKTASMPAFDLQGFLTDGPSHNLGGPAQVFGYALDDTNPDGTQKIKDGLTGNHDLIAVMIVCNTNNTTPDSAENLWLQDIRVNALALDDHMTTTQIARDIASRCGWDMGGAVVASDMNGLPFDTDGTDWGSELDYLSDLDNNPWQVYGNEFRRAPWNQNEYTTSREEGSVLDLAPQPIYDKVVVIWQGASGKKHTVELSRGPGLEYPPVTMDDTQRNGDNANDYAHRLLDEYGSRRYSGSVDLLTGSREVHAGRNLNITDWDDGNALPLRIQDTTQDASGVKLGIEEPAIVSRYLARLKHRNAQRGRSGG